MTDDDEDRVYKARLVGAPTRQVAAQFGLTNADVDRIVDSRLPPFTQEYMARSMRLDLERLEMMTLRCIDQLNKGSLAAGHLLLKTLERRASTLGYDAPIRVDAVQLASFDQRSQTSPICSAFVTAREEAIFSR